MSQAKRMLVRSGQEAVLLFTGTALAVADGSTTGVGAAVDLPTPDQGLVLELDVTSAATAVGDTLDVFVQSKFDGTNWVDIPLHPGARQRRRQAIPDQDHSISDAG